ncbi:MAG: ABC transporter ATP-binding protein, partial [Limnobacter sp.]|nr:ABC transporter ATP-binding protein [Limnobacter sp.]
RSFNSLSGGERRRASLAAAFVQNPNVLLLDEPMSQLDWAHQVVVGKLIRTWVNGNSSNKPETASNDTPPGKAAVWITHDPNMALRFATHLLAIGPGGKTWQGGVCDMAHPEVFAQVYGCSIETSADPFLFFPKVIPDDSLPA